MIVRPRRSASSPGNLRIAKESRRSHLPNAGASTSGHSAAVEGAHAGRGTPLRRLLPSLRRGGRGARRRRGSVASLFFRRKLMALPPGREGSALMTTLRESLARKTRRRKIDFYRLAFLGQLRRPAVVRGRPPPARVRTVSPTNLSGGPGILPTTSDRYSGNPGKFPGKRFRPRRLLNYPSLFFAKSFTNDIYLARLFSEKHPEQPPNTDEPRKNLQAQPKDKLYHLTEQSHSSLEALIFLIALHYTFYRNFIVDLG